MRNASVLRSAIMSGHSVRRWLNRWTRRLHRWGAILTLAPLLVVICTGILLQVKKQVSWVQPPTQRGSAAVPSISFDRVLEIARGIDCAAVASWDDIDRLDVRPDRGIIKIRARSRWEIQIDAGSGEVLHVAYRRSDLIESLHDGSFFGDPVKLWVFLPSSIILLGLWLTGAYLWLIPIVSRRRAQIRASRARAARTD